MSLVFFCLYRIIDPADSLLLYISKVSTGLSEYSDYNDL
jgi:hypothetical protein